MPKFKFKIISDKKIKKTEIFCKGKNYEEALREAAKQLEVFDESGLTIVPSCKDLEKKCVSYNTYLYVFNILNKYFPWYYENRNCLNEFTTKNLKNDFNLAIIGTVAPAGLVHPYTGKKQDPLIWIQNVTGVNFKNFIVNKNWDELKNNLDNFGIVFVDVAKKACVKSKSSKDKDVLMIVRDDETLEKCSENCRHIISTGAPVKKILDKEKIENNDIYLFAFGSKKEIFEKIVRDALGF